MSSYAPIPETVQTSQPGLQDSETYPFGRSAPEEADKPCCCCRAFNYLAMVCECVFKYCGAVCECEGEDDFDN